MSEIFFNAHHSPVGSFASFTLGSKGAKGGLGLELKGPADEAVYVGLETKEGGSFQTLPFYEVHASAAEDYDVEGLSDFQFPNALIPFADSQIERHFGAGVDEWIAGDLSFKIYSPPKSVEDPDYFDVRDSVAPAVLVQVRVDNRTGDKPRRAFFGYEGSDRSTGMRILKQEGLLGVGQGTSVAIATTDQDVYAGLAWQPEAILSPRLAENLGFMLGSIGMLVGTVDPGELKTFTFSVAFFRESIATTGIETKYLYRRYFTNIEDVLKHSLKQAHETIQLSERFDKRLKDQLSPDRCFMASHAIRSYFGSTQLLERSDGKPLWVVHEGEYRMMNTFDLTVDQAFFELIFNPWTVRNVLDLFVEHYSYEDEVRFPGSGDMQPGGISFTHDMGVANAFSPFHYSGYEQAGLHGCFSYMTAEELLNWVLTAGLYVSHTHDDEWASRQKSILLKSLTSLENRDALTNEERNGVIGADAARCRGGSEITTYDSLDASLGQARNNLYLAVKGWATYLLLANMLERVGEHEPAARAINQARRASKTILAARDEKGLLPAIIGEGVDARIIPAIEALIYPSVTGLDDGFEELRDALQAHFDSILKPGICLFEDGGWKLSSTSRNSWLSKIYLCQAVAEQVFGYAPDGTADAAHVAWLKDEKNSYFAWSDQMLAGKAVGSRYYPRGVTSILWLAQGKEPLKHIRDLLIAQEVTA